MSEAPSFISLCIKSIKDAILDENGNLSYVYQLPTDLFDQILPNLPPLALQFLQDAMPSSSSNDSSFSDDSVNPTRKRKRFEGFDVAWKILYKSRWPENVQQDDESSIDWQQIYWEKHLQTCLNATLESVSITSFNGSLGEVDISDTLLRYVSHEKCVNRLKSYSKLAYHCERFGSYARCLRLQSVHCVAELGYLLRNTRLEKLDVHWLKSKQQVDGLCKLLEQNTKTLKSIEFVNCKFFATLVSAICDSLHVPNVIESFSIKRSSIHDNQSVPLPRGLELLLASASNLTSLILSDNHMSGKTAKMVFDTLLDSESGLRVLDLSENNISGWLSHIKWVSTDRQIKKYMKSLRMLNLRSNNLRTDDMDCLKYAAKVYMPNLEVLNLSDNPLGAYGVNVLIPYLKEKSNSDTPLTELHLENCQLDSWGGFLLDELAALNVPLKSLSIGDNPLFSFINNDFGVHLGRFLCSGIEVVDIKGAELGKSAFSDAQKEITKELNLVRINISGNGGAAEIVGFLSTVILHAPNLISVDASSNWIPVESLPAICSFLEAAKGRLEHLDLQNNHLCNIPDIASLLAKYQINGKPNILLSSPQATLYDNDP